MLRTLQLHPDSECTAVTRIDVDIARPRAGQLMLHYRVSGTIDELRLPPVAAPARADDLWRHTCFEAFVRATRGAGYHEFNFAPSTQWAAYRFTGYREGMSTPGEIRAPRIDARAHPGSFELEAALEFDTSASMPSDAPWQLGLACVLEEANGRKSYWALVHPPGAPDFHHRVGFAHELSKAPYA